MLIRLQKIRLVRANKRSAQLSNPVKNTCFEQLGFHFHVTNHKKICLFELRVSGGGNEVIHFHRNEDLIPFSLFRVGASQGIFFPCVWFIPVLTCD